MDRPDLEALIGAALVDTYNEDEELSAWLAVLEDELAFPFATAVLGTPVTVTGLDLPARGGVCAVCTSGRHRKWVPLSDLELPDPQPAEVAWVRAYRLWNSRT
jgi:hypothetical protein